jgi:CheY-like chemotaxis protein
MAAGLESIKALVVEDNTHMRSLLRALLNALGIKDVGEAIHGQAALDILRERKIDLVLTDLAMVRWTDWNSPAICAMTKTAPIPLCPIIMITGHTEKYRVEAARDAGVTEFSPSPSPPTICSRASPKYWNGPAPLCAATAISGPIAGATQRQIIPALAPCR